MKKDETNQHYLIGVDGGGTGTRVLLTTLENFKQGQILAQVQTGPCALGLGREKAWSVIRQAIEEAFRKAQVLNYHLSDCSLSVGLSGANNQTWKKEFDSLQPGFQNCVVNTDALTTFWGAYPEGVGIVLALGTGSVGLRRNLAGEILTVSGWGFPAGDEASGSWLGLKVAGFIQKIFDGREKESALSTIVKENFSWTNTDQFLQWLAAAGPNEYAKIAPLVFQAAKQKDEYALKLINHALFDIEKMLSALDPIEKEKFCLCGGIGQALTTYLPAPLQARLEQAQNTSAYGALHLLIKDSYAI